jgi:lysophospholipid acyltransferase (LPLAT)-like uncharacterized protein
MTGQPSRKREVALGSAYEAVEVRHRSRKPQRRLKSWLSFWLTGAFARVFPWIYKAYCWLVWQTSDLVDDVNPKAAHAKAHYDGFVGVLWHQEVFTVAYAYQPTQPHTLASVGNFGRVITHMLEACRFVVFRGGSSSGRARRREGVLRDMIQHKLHTRRVVYGITVDGSKGPAYRLKKGAVVIARSCRAPLYVTRCSFKRRFEAGTWDRTVFPLPFNTARLRMIGPYWIDPEADDDELEACRAFLEEELLELNYWTEVEVGALLPGEVPDGYPADWRPRWTPGDPGLRRIPHDLRADAPPPWARVPDEAKRSPQLA